MLYACWELDRLDNVKGPPKRTTAYRSKADALAWRNEPVRRKKRYGVAVLLLRTDHYDDGRTQVVPEFGIQALGQSWSLPAMGHENHLVITGEIPDCLYYVEPR